MEMACPTTEKYRGLNPGDGNQDSNADGFTNLEDYLNSIPISQED